MQKDKIIYGKNTTERIVAAEVHDNQVAFFIEKDDGVEIKWEPNVFWTLANRRVDETWQRMAGNLHYKWAKTYESEQAWRDGHSSINRRYNDIYTAWQPIENCMLVKGFTYFKGMEPKDVSILSWDLETTGLRHNKDSDILIIANTYRKGDKQVQKLFARDEYNSTKEMIEDWCNWVRIMDPSIMLAYNGNGFDWPYLQYVATMNNADLNLGRDGSPVQFKNRESKFRKDGSQFIHYHKVHIYGRENIDGMFLAIRHDIQRKYPSYRLKDIVEYEGLTKENRSFINFDDYTPNQLYRDPEMWKEFKKYANEDTEDSLKLFDIHIPAQFYATQSIAKPFQTVTESATGSQVNSIMVRAYMEQFHSIPKGEEESAYEGAISAGMPGIYNNVKKLDVASLYPSIMLQYKTYDTQKDPLNIFFGMLEYFRNERLKNKKLAEETGEEYYEGLQQAQKVMINSAYGFMGTKGLNFNSPKNAALVTKYGRDILQEGVQWACGFKMVRVVDHIVNKGKPHEEIKYKWLPEYQVKGCKPLGNGYQIVNCDTDSFSYIGGSNTIEQDMNELNALYPDLIHWEPDGEFDKMIVFRAKNYVMKTGQKIKTKGQSIKATTKEKALKGFIDEWVNNILMYDEYCEELQEKLLTIYKKYANMILKVEDITQWTVKKTVTDKVLKPQRENEAKVRRAIGDKYVAEGDKIRCFFLPNGEMSLEENFTGSYSKATLLSKLYKTACVFETVVDIKAFPKYTNKGPRMKLAEEMGIEPTELMLPKELEKTK